jgi:PTS system nitrogen regulatory IIA component
MDIASLLVPEAVRIASATSSKKRLLQQLSELAAEAYDIPSDQAIDALIEREALGPTGVGKGIALPHARLPGVQNVVGCFMRLDKAIEFESVDRQPVDLVFALFAPAETGVDHLKALALVSRTMRDADVCSKLRSARDIATVHAVLTEAAQSEAA